MTASDPAARVRIQTQWTRIDAEAYTILLFGLDLVIDTGFAVASGGEGPRQYEFDGTLLDGNGILVLVEKRQTAFLTLHSKLLLYTFNIKFIGSVKKRS